MRCSDKCAAAGTPATPVTLLLCGAPGRGPRDRKPWGLGVAGQGHTEPRAQAIPCCRYGSGLQTHPKAPLSRPPSFLKEAPPMGWGDQPGTGKTSDVTWLRLGSSTDHSQPSLSSSWEGAPRPANRAAPAPTPAAKSFPSAFTPEAQQQVAKA